MSGGHMLHGQMLSWQLQLVSVKDCPRELLEGLDKIGSVTAEIFLILKNVA